MSVAGTSPSGEPDLQERVKRQMNAMPIHESWEASYRTEGNERFYEQCFDEIVRQLHQPEGSLALDIGCGIGANSVRLARRGYRVIGGDYSEAIQEPARRNIERQGLSDRVTIQREDILNLSFPDATFDLVLCWGVLMHVPEAVRALDQLVRVTRPGGYLVFEEINVAAPEARLMRWAWRTFKRGQIAVQPTEAGFEQTSRFADETLFWRHLDPTWLSDQLRRRDATLVSRRAGLFSDLYMYARPRAAAGLVHRLNRFWLRSSARPGPAYHNVFLFRKNEPAS
jgi:2-polyprenyl-3-methyl-5-hydroxy-6-metoxy-1,4-benzoquinol methylase